MKVAKVIANPYCALDADGVPQGVVGMPGAAGIYIGAMPDAVASEKSGKKRFYFPRNRDGSRRVVTVPVEHAAVRADIARAVNDGSLLAADAETARCFGISEFVEPEKILAIERANALESFRVLRGKDAAFRDVPEAPTPYDFDDEPKAPVEPAKAGRVRLGPSIEVEPAKPEKE